MVMETNKVNTKKKILWSFIDFSQINFFKEMYNALSGEFVCGFWSLKGDKEIQPPPAPKGTNTTKVFGSMSHYTPYQILQGSPPPPPRECRAQWKSIKSWTGIIL